MRPSQTATTLALVSLFANLFLYRYWLCVSIYCFATYMDRSDKHCLLAPNIIYSYCQLYIFIFLSVHLSPITGPLKDHRVYSMTPIFIQQDLYCISTKQPSEHTTWPMRSTAIINHSQNISRDKAVEYRQAYRESAVVKNALQARQHTKGMLLFLCVFWHLLVFFLNVVYFLSL